MNDEIREALTGRGVDMLRFADISKLPEGQIQGYNSAVVFLMALSREFVLDVYEGRIAEETKDDEFTEKEHAADALADWLAEYIRQRGYRAYSQSEKSNMENGNFNRETRSSRLPHKTIARLAGLGFIGKNALLITGEYGCAFAMCTVLTDAPVETVSCSPVASKCGTCVICANVCPAKAIHGREWSEEGGRDAVVDVHKCTACALKCMVNCPWSLRYARRA